MFETVVVVTVVFPFPVYCLTRRSFEHSVRIQPHRLMLSDNSSCKETARGLISHVEKAVNTAIRKDLRFH